MHILFTRPFDDCHELMLRFKSLGHIVSHIPVISIQKIIYESLDFSLFKGIIFTSSNAIKFLDTQKIDKKIKCFCVGNATEKVAKMKGFQNIYVASGNVENLKEIILQNFATTEGKLIYVTGQKISSDLNLNNEQTQLYMNLIKEEFEETAKAFEEEDLVEVADGLADMVWVIMGMCNSVGIDFDKIWEEVKSSNMSKFVDGKFIKNDAGKIMKPETYFKPNIKKALGL